VGPDSQDDERLYRNRRLQRDRADESTMLTRPAIRTAPLEPMGTSAPVTATAPGYGGRPVPRDFSAVPAHRPAPARQNHRPFGKNL